MAAAGADPPSREQSCHIRPSRGKRPDPTCDTCADRRAFIAEDRGQHPDGRPILCSAELRPRNSRSEFHFLKEAPVLDPRPESALPYRIRKKPAGGPSPARAEFTCARVA